jgi:hypothetical protein
MRPAQRQDPAQAPFQQRVIAGLRVRQAIAMTERQRALANALEHDGIEPPLGHQIHGRVKPVGREAGAGAEAYGHGRSPPAATWSRSRNRWTSAAFGSTVHTAASGGTHFG